MFKTPPSRPTLIFALTSAMSFASSLVCAPVAFAQQASTPTAEAEAGPQPAAPVEDASPAAPPVSAGQSTGQPTDQTSDQAPELAPPPPSEQNVKRARPASRGTGDYQEMLRFAPEDNGFTIDNPQLKWLVEDGNRIDLGGLKLSSESIRINLEQSKRDKAPQRFDDPKASKYVTALSIRWPDVLARTGTVSIETLDGKIAWSKEVTEENRKAWQDDLGFVTEAMRTPHLKTTWGEFDISRQTFGFLYEGGRYRACFTKSTSELEKLRICTRPFSAKSKGERVKIFPSKTLDKENSGLYLGEKNLGPKGLINLKPGTNVVLRVQFADLSLIEISSQPADPKLLDVVQSSDGREIILTGHGAKPLGSKARIIAKPVTHFWAPTGIPQERIWQVSIGRESPLVRVAGAFNVPFTLLFSFDRLPKESDRVYVKKTRSSGTYSSSPVILGYNPSGSKVSSKESYARNTSARFFEWTFMAPKKGEENRARLLVQDPDGPRPWVAHHRMYRSYPYEVSARLTGILATDFTFIIMGEISAAAWFESLGFTQNSLLSKQRWGLAARYLKGLTAIESQTGQKVNDLTILNADLKYNILPGVWHRDEIVGVMGSFEDVQLAGFKVNLAGFGAYWARTMPRIFNDIFNFLPLMDYPKYVDVELIYFPISLTSGTAAGSSMNLNFHGRVFWSQRFYGEAGFGVRRYNFSVPNPNRPSALADIELSAGYGTAGIGFVW